MKLPFKTRIVEYAIDRNEAINAKEIYTAMKEEYSERYCSLKNIEGILLGLMGIGIVKADSVSYDEAGRLDVKYMITDFGRTYKDVIPVHD